MPAARILIVDDDTQVLGLYMRILAGRGLTVTGTISGLDALAAAADSHFDVAVIDLSMPDIDGFEILKTLHRNLPGLKIVVMSGVMPGVLLNSAGLFGAAATLQKPVSPEAFIGAVEALIHSRSASAGSGAQSSI